MEIRSKEILMVPIDQITPNQANNNRHSAEQLDRLAKIIKHQGFRNPLTVSNQSGLLVAGHARWEVAKRLGITELPVMFQDFNSPADEYAHMTADNAIASWAELDLSMVNSMLPDFGPDLDISLLGIKDFLLDPAEFDEPAPKSDPSMRDPLLKQCPNCGVTIGDG